MTEMPFVTDAQYDGDYRIRVTFDDGSRNTIDFRKWLTGPMFEPLRDKKCFQRFFVSGGTVAWPNGATSLPRRCTMSPDEPALDLLDRDRDGSRELAGRSVLP